MAKTLLTDVVVRNLPLPEKGQKCVWDESLAGFGVRVSQGGAKTWIVLDPRSKVRVAETIGRYPIIDLKTARGEARARLAEATLGKRRMRSVSYSAALEDYLKEAELKESTRYQYSRVLKSFKFGRVGDISAVEVEKQLEKRKTPESFPILRAFFHWCKRKRYLSEHPMAGMEAPTAYKKRARVLSDEELKKVWNACGSDRYGTLVKLLMLTGQRVGEINALSEKMVEGGCVTLPASLTKNGREHTFPLGETAQSLLMFEIDWSGFSKAKKALDTRSGVKDWTLHDLRRTFRTNLGKLGVRPDIAERLVNHISSRSEMEETYDLWNYLPEMRDAVNKWEAYIVSILNARSSVAGA